MKIKVPYNKLNKLSADFSEFLADLADTADRLGADLEADSAREFVETNIDDDKLPLAIADLLIAEGCVIENFPLFIEIESKTANCPFIEGTWEDWKAENHTFYEADGRIFIGTNAHNGEDMNFTDLTSVRANLVLPQDLPINE
jgi:hypothetical protein